MRLPKADQSKCQTGGTFLCRQFCQKGIGMKKYFDYLERLRKSDRINMYGAAPFLLKKFPELSNDAKRAAEILKAWMSSYSTGGRDK